MKREKKKELQKLVELDQEERSRFGVVESDDEDEGEQPAQEELEPEVLVAAELTHRSGFRMRLGVLKPVGSASDQKFSLGDMREAFEALCLVIGQDDFAGALLQQVGSEVEVRLT